MKYRAHLLHLLNLTVISGLSMPACVQKMGTQGHLRPLDDATAFNQSTRQPPDGTVPRGPTILTQTAPRPPLTHSLLERGRDQYQVFCLPCHGVSGRGDGIIVQRGFLAPPSYHTPRLRQASDEHYFNVITEGYGAMYSYADRVAPQDRWAITAYIRALQLSQNAPWSKLAPVDQEKLR